MIKLKQENETLTSANKTLAEEKTTLFQEKETVVKENTGLQTDKTQLTKSVQEYTAKNEELATKVKIASALKAQDITIYAITGDGKEKDGGSYRAKKVDKLKFQFKLPVNPIADKRALQSHRSSSPRDRGRDTGPAHGLAPSKKECPPPGCRP